MPKQYRQPISYNNFTIIIVSFLFSYLTLWRGNIIFHYNHLLFFFYEYHLEINTENIIVFSFISINNFILLNILIAFTHLRIMITFVHIVSFSVPHVLITFILLYCNHFYYAFLFDLIVSMKFHYTLSIS